ncbi:MAG: hypothetical protein GTO14_16190 [Anaerolineales bacterium]|nr:hypothetical protein [Anaerolineales bacterium]
MAEIISMPKLGFDMAEGVLVRWVVSEGETVEKGQVLAEIETDKATVEVEAMVSGVVHTHLISEGSVTPVGTPIAVIGAADEDINIEALTLEASEVKPIAEVSEPVREAERQKATTLETVVQEGDGRLPSGVRASPLARRMAADQGIDLSHVSGSGPGGRIVKRDVEAALTAEPVRPSEFAPMPVPMGAPRQTERIPLSKLRDAIGRRMSAAKQQVPHFYVTVEVDAVPMMELRAEANAQLPEEEKLSVNDFIVKAAALTLREFPNLNASLQGDEIVRHGEINIGVAVAVEDGLLTVVVKNADAKPLRLISNEIRNMVARTREGKVRAEDIEGSTFTVSNLGMFGVEHFIAIVNPPEAAILAIGGVQERPVVKEGVVVPGLRLQCTLSADHRVTDGAEAARWLQLYKQYLQLPLRLML